MSYKIDFELGLILEKIKTPVEEEKFIKKYAINKEGKYFYEYLQQYIAESKMTMSKVMTNSRLNKNYGYNIVNGTRKSPGRDKVIALCIGAKMTFEECQEALKIAHHPILNPRDERDIRIAVFINNGGGDVLKLNIILEGKGVLPLNV